MAGYKGSWEQLAYYLFEPHITPRKGGRMGTSLTHLTEEQADTQVTQWMPKFRELRNVLAGISTLELFPLYQTAS